MNDPFHVAALLGDSIPQAFPLVQATCPGVELASWKAFVESFSDRCSADGGVLAAFSSAGYIGGVLAYRLDRDLRAGLVLDVQLFTPVDLLNSSRMVRALLDAAEWRASELGCAGLRIRLYNDQAGVAAHLRTLGLSPEAGLFWKKIDRTRASN